MKFAVALLGLASLASATDDKYYGGDNYGGGGDDYGHGKDTIYYTKPDVTQHTKVYETKVITKEKPVTETKYIDGKTVIVTWTKTDYIKTYVPITYYETVEAPDVTQHTKVYETKVIPKEQPVTETKTINGETIVVTYTKTAYVKTYVPVTYYETVKGPHVTKTAEAEECITITETKPITVTKTQEGKTTYVTLTKTKTTTVGAEHTVTVGGEAVTKTTKVYETVTVTQAGGTITVPGEVVYETVHKTVTETVHGVPSTVVLPPTTQTTEEVVTETTTLVPPPVTSQPVEEPSLVPTAAAQANRAPVLAMVAGVAGAVALL